MTLPAIHIYDDRTIFAWSYVDCPNRVILEMLHGGLCEWFAIVDGIAYGSEDPEPVRVFTDFLNRMSISLERVRDPR